MPSPLTREDIKRNAMNSLMKRAIRKICLYHNRQDSPYYKALDKGIDRVELTAERDRNKLIWIIAVYFDGIPEPVTAEVPLHKNVASFTDQEITPVVDEWKTQTEDVFKNKKWRTVQVDRTFEQLLVEMVDEQ